MHYLLSFFLVSTVEANYDVDLGKGSRLGMQSFNSLYTPKNEFSINYNFRLV